MSNVKSKFPVAPPIFKLSGLKLLKCCNSNKLSQSKFSIFHFLILFKYNEKIILIFWRKGITI